MTLMAAGDTSGVPLAVHMVALANMKPHLSKLSR